MTTNSDLDYLKSTGEAPEWLTIEGYVTLSKGYLLKGETPKMLWKRASEASARNLNKPELADKFFELMWNNWLCLASPVAANMGTERGLPISCYGSYTEDSVDGIMDTMSEVASLSKNGGGLGVYFGDVRPRGSKIKDNGESDGIIPFLKILDSVTIGISQGGTRRGATSVYLPIEHEDFDEFIEMRKPSGDLNRQCLNLHHAVSIGDDFMEKVFQGESWARERWKKVLKTRFETGEPYIFFRDTTNKANPECYKANSLSVKASQLCSEITLHSDKDHTYVCCLSSMNLARWDEWKDTDAVKMSVWFLDGVMEEFIKKSDGKKGFEKARNFALKSRALGLGVLGFHSLLQAKGYPFGDLRTYTLNGEIFKHMKEEAEKATKELYETYGAPEWCEGFERRNTHLLAVAPTVSNSIISGNVSAGIEPLAAIAYAQKTAKGTFLQKNRDFTKLLQDLGKDNEKVWQSIIVGNGSVQHLNFLTDEQKEVFATAREIDQMVLVRLAAQRQKYIDQGQSLNLFFFADADPKYYNAVHLEAYRQGLKTLYYSRASSILQGDNTTRNYERKSTLADIISKEVDSSETSCTFCEG
jgi:ribonucleoside-diphosphate reductase alpha chain